MQILLDCSHKQEVHAFSDLTLFVACYECQANVRLAAVETREWKFRCKTGRCRFARFSGSSKDAAVMVYRRHNMTTGHEKHEINFEWYPESKEMVQKLFGRKVRTVIPIGKPHSQKLKPEVRRTPLIERQDKLEGPGF